MSDHQRYLEGPHEQRGFWAEADREAIERGYPDAESWWEDMKEQAALDKWERENDR